MRFLWFHALELIVLFIAVIFLPNLKNFRLGGFVLYMSLVCATELSGSNYGFFGLGTNSGIYDCYLVISQIVIMGIFFKILQFQKANKIIYLTCCTLIIGAMVFCTKLQGLEKFDTYSSIIGSFAQIILSLLLIGKLFLNDEEELILIKNPYFWVAGGTLIFNLGYLVITGLAQYIAVKDLRIDGIILYRLILPILIGIVYTCYGYSFILCKLTNRLSRS
jgi:hypothetical protein